MISEPDHNNQWERNPGGADSAVKKLDTLAY